MRERIIAYVTSAEDRAVLVRGLRGQYSVQFCQTQREAVAAVMANPVGGLVWELHPDVGDNLASAITALRNDGRFIPVVLRLELDQSVARELNRISSSIAPLRLSTRHFDDFERDIALSFPRPSWQGVRPRTAHLAILERLSENTPADVLDITTGAVLAGHRKTSVESLARLCKLPVRTLEWRLAASQVLPARALLGWTVSLHAMWRLDVLGMVPKRVASEGGFATAEALYALVNRHTGSRPADIRRHGASPACFNGSCRRCIRAERHRRGARTAMKELLTAGRRISAQHSRDVAYPTLAYGLHMD
jgi:hypothetical protein